ncbi:phage tail assembly chaperone [Pseudomonas salomonii]|uniref:Phage tail assembly chaperone protein n=1 Tax=Pseudomonas salomonii TaxID=191391 RepID=A0A1H3IKY3_9PSED|nr:phage tail assembly chaperone [Pseudomonas salomonii]SDY28247.1 Phage tail assembly chaperone protein [Pseudomonas salomonii]
MRAYYNDSGYVFRFTSADMPGLEYLEISDGQAIATSLNLGLVPVVRNGQLVFEANRAALMKAVRERRCELLQEADARVCMLNDQALIAGTMVDQDTRQALAVYRQALRDIPETTDPSAVVWPQRPW